MDGKWDVWTMGIGEMKGGGGVEKKNHAQQQSVALF